MKDTCGDYLYCPIAGIDEEHRAISLHWNALRDGEGQPVNLTSVKKSIARYESTDGAVIAGGHQAAGHLDLSDDGTFTIRVLDKRAWQKITSSTFNAVLFGCSKADGSYRIEAVELVDGPQNPNQLKAYKLNGNELLKTAGGIRMRGSLSDNRVETFLKGLGFGKVDRYRQEATEKATEHLKAALAEHSAGRHENALNHARTACTHLAKLNDYGSNHREIEPVAPVREFGSAEEAMEGLSRAVKFKGSVQSTAQYGFLRDLEPQPISTLGKARRR
jgi:hypothetical protein